MLINSGENKSNFLSQDHQIYSTLPKKLDKIESKESDMALNTIGMQIFYIPSRQNLKLRQNDANIYFDTILNSKTLI